MGWAVPALRTRRAISCTCCGWSKPSGPGRRATSAPPSWPSTPRGDEEEAAQRQRPWHRALIAERAARFYLAHGIEHAAHLLAQARQQYLAWGATAKVAQLDWAYPALRPTPRSPPRGRVRRAPPARGQAAGAVVLHPEVHVDAHPLARGMLVRMHAYAGRQHQVAQEDVAQGAGGGGDAGRVHASLLGCALLAADCAGRAHCRCWPPSSAIICPVIAGSGKDRDHGARDFLGRGAAPAAAWRRTGARTAPASAARWAGSGRGRCR